MIHHVSPEAPHGDVTPDPPADLDSVEPVEVASDYHVEILVPLTSDQLTALERFAREERVGVIEAAQQLIEAALNAQTRR